MGLRELNTFILMAVLFALLSGAIAGMATRTISRRNPRSDARMHRTRLRNAVSIALPVVTVIFLHGMLLLRFVELQLVTSFNHRMTVLAAYIEDTQVKRLRADWAIMKGRADYEAINKKMATMAAGHQVSLPKPLWE